MRFAYLEKHPKLRVVLEWSIKLTIFALLSIAIYKQVFQNKDIDAITFSLSNAISNNRGLLIAAVLLMPLNWLLETFKWQLLMRRVEILSLPKAIAAVLAGVTFTMFTPNRMGEYGGRFMFIKEPLRADAWQATILGSIAQIICTGMFGIWGTLLILYPQYSMNPVGLVVGAIMFISLLVLYFNSSLLYRIVPPEGFLGRLRARLEVLQQIPSSLLSYALLMAVLRYLVYALQYLLLLNALAGAQLINLKGFSLVGMAFLAQTLIPSIAIIDLGIRGNIALRAFEGQGINEAGLLAAAFALWFINLVVPALLGYLVILWKRWFQPTSPASGSERT